MNLASGSIRRRFAVQEKNLPDRIDGRPRIDPTPRSVCLARRSKAVPFRNVHMMDLSKLCSKSAAAPLPSISFIRCCVSLIFLSLYILPFFPFFPESIPYIAASHKGDIICFRLLVRACIQFSWMNGLLCEGSSSDSIDLYDADDVTERYARPGNESSVLTLSITSFCKL